LVINLRFTITITISNPCELPPRISQRVLASMVRASMTKCAGPLAVPHAPVTTALTNLAPLSLALVKSTRSTTALVRSAPDRIESTAYDCRQGNRAQDNRSATGQLRLPLDNFYARQVEAAPRRQVVRDLRACKRAAPLLQPLHCLNF
jgi:hypothetical protein